MLCINYNNDSVMDQLLWVTVPRYPVKHYPDISVKMFWMRWTFKMVTLGSSRLLLVMHVGFIQAAEGLNRTKMDLFIERRNSAIRLPLDSNYSSFLNLQPSSLPYQIWGSTITCARASQVAEWKRICLPMQETQEMQVWSLRQEDTLE